MDMLYDRTRGNPMQRNIPKQSSVIMRVDVKVICLLYNWQLTPDESKRKAENGEARSVHLQTHAIVDFIVAQSDVVLVDRVPIE